MTKKLSWLAAVIICGAVSVAIWFSRSGFAYHFVSVQDMESLLNSGRLIGSEPSDVTRFLNFHKIHYEFNPGVNQGAASQGCHVRLTAFVDPASQGLFRQTNIAVFFHFAAGDCRLASYEVRERTILP